MKRLFNFITSRMVIMTFGIIGQVILTGVGILLLRWHYGIAALAISVLSVIFSIYIINRRVNSSYNLGWVFLVLAFPFVGLFVFILNGQFGTKKKNVNRLRQLHQDMVKTAPDDRELLSNLEIEDPHGYAQARYLSRSGYPLCGATATKYYDDGEKMFRDMMEDIKKAKRFIFAEFFIVDTGELLTEFISVLEQKANEGVDVRLIYDDIGTIWKVPYNFFKKLRDKGIKCMVFNRIKPVVTSIVNTNNRDHRKILCVDGLVGYTGGLNLADEYINKIELYGHWKDTGIRLEGDAVRNMTSMFLASWGYVNETTIDYNVYNSQKSHLQVPGFVQPYAGAPFIGDSVAENVYLNLINRATKYVYITTPYLAIDGEMITAIKNAARSGVDVRLMMPGIPDKKVIYLLSQSYFSELLEVGVKIYRYTPGFLHAKSMVCDDCIAVIGSVNLDFRSLYLHFENGVWMYGTEAVKDMKEDFINTLSVCEEDTVESVDERLKHKKIPMMLLRVIAPIL